MERPMMMKMNNYIKRGTLNTRSSAMQTNSLPTIEPLIAIYDISFGEVRKIIVSIYDNRNQKV